MFDVFDKIGPAFDITGDEAAVFPVEAASPAVEAEDGITMSGNMFGGKIEPPGVAFNPV